MQAQTKHLAGWTRLEMESSGCICSSNRWDSGVLSRLIVLFGEQIVLILESSMRRLILTVFNIFLQP